MAVDSHWELNLQTLKKVKVWGKRPPPQLSEGSYAPEPVPVFIQFMMYKCYWNCSIGLCSRLWVWWARSALWQIILCSIICRFCLTLNSAVTSNFCATIGFCACASRVHKVPCRAGDSEKFDTFYFIVVYVSMRFVCWVIVCVRDNSWLL